MKYLSVIWLLICFSIRWGSAQTLSSVTLEACYNWTQAHNPLVRQLDLIEQAKAYSLSNAAKDRLPQLQLNGQATYQSEVTQLPLDLPNLELPTLSKDQYKLYGELMLPLTNSGLVRLRQQAIETAAALEKQNIIVTLHELYERVNQLYFGVLLLDAQVAQLRTVQDDLAAALEQTQAAVSNGTAVESNLQLLTAERIKTNQSITEQQSRRKAFIAMLAALTGQDITEQTEFTVPALIAAPTAVNRPELSRYALQEQALRIQGDQLKKKLIPNLGLFLQGGVGRPALDFLSNELTPYYLGGVRLTWNLSQLYTTKNESEILQLSQEKVGSARDAFLLQLDLTTTQQAQNIAKYQTLLQADEELVSIRAAIRETAEVQLTNGLISALDYISYLNEESRARQQLVLHQLQLLQARYDQATTLGHRLARSD